jgi:hypothetical protein
MIVDARRTCIAAHGRSCLRLQGRISDPSFIVNICDKLSFFVHSEHSVVGAG